MPVGTEATVIFVLLVLQILVGSFRSPLCIKAHTSISREMVIEYVEKNDIDAATLFINLPNELKTHVIQNMTLKERENIGSIGNLHELVKIAGCNQFSNVNFKSATLPNISAWDETTSPKKIEDNEVAQYFKHASTKELNIEGVIDVETETKIKLAFKSLSFEELCVSFSNDYSGRIISELTRGCQRIEEMTIHWECLNDEFRGAKEVLKYLPFMRKCVITGNSVRPLIDDDVLLHIINHSESSVDIDIRNTIVSTRGLETAFEVVQKCERDLRVRIFVSVGVAIQYLRTLGHNFEKQSTFSMFKHTSGATIWSAPQFGVLPMQLLSDDCAIVMKSNFR